jgi:hypothetical protein
VRPPLHSILFASSEVKALIGTPIRLYPFGHAVQGVAKPYVTWQSITAIPDNSLNQLPDIDDFRVQVDVWAATEASCYQVAEAVRDAVEPYAQMINSGGTTRDPETGAYRYLLEFQFFHPR